MNTIEISKAKIILLLNRILKLTGIFTTIKINSNTLLYICPNGELHKDEINAFEKDIETQIKIKKSTEYFTTLHNTNCWVYSGNYNFTNAISVDLWLKNTKSEEQLIKKEKIKTALVMLHMFYEQTNETIIQLNTAKNRFEEYLSKVNQGIIVCTPSGQISYFNTSITRIFNETQILNRNSKEMSYDMFDKENQLIEKENYPVFNINKTHIPIENAVFGISINNAALIWIKLDGIPIFDDNNNLREVVFIIEEITNEKLSKDEIIQSLNYLEKTQKIASLGNFTVKIKENVWYGNEILYKILGFEQATVKNYEEWFNLISVEHKEKFLNQLHENINSNCNEYSFTYKIQKHNTNEARWVRSNAKIMRDNLGNAETIIGVLQDITDIKTAEQNAIENESKYKQILNNVNDVYYKVNWDLNICDISPSIKHFTHLLPNQIIGINLEQFIDIRTINSEFKKEILLKKQINNYHLDILAHDSILIPVSISASLTVGANGEPLYIEGFVRDISERLEMESKIRINEHKFKSYIQFSPVAIIVADRNGNILESNPALTRLTGYFSNSISLTINSPLITAKSKETFNNHASKIEKFGYATDEVSIIANGGEIKHVRLDSVQIPNGQYLCFITDISYHYKIEKKLRQEQEYLEAAQQIAKVGNAFIDFEKGTWESSAMLDEIVGFTKDKNKEIETWIKVIHPESFEAIKNYFLLEVLPNQKDLDMDLKIIRQTDGETRWIHAICKSKYNDDKSIKSMRFTLQDITERKKNEEELIESKLQIREFADLIQSVREEEKIALAREIHDDLGQMLVALKINMGMLKMKLSTGLHEFTKELIEIEMNKMLDYTSKTIDTTRKIMTDLRSENIKNLGFIESAKNYIHNFNERFKINCAFSNKLKTVNLEQKQTIALYRILQESLNNVVKHANATDINVSLSQTKKEILLKISDNGIGFDQSKCMKNDSYGLRGMNERVALLGGKIDIKSKKNKGTCVCVEIPRELLNSKTVK